MSVVLDASVYVAARSPREAHCARARRALDALPVDEPILAPSLFRVEVLSAFARRPEPDAFIDAIDALVCSPRFDLVAVDDEVVDRAVSVARAARIRAYDAVYVAVALLRDATLLTLDEEVATRLAAAVPEAKVRVP
jgi:predicted nucleic acid-binding protein